jgi:uncharacterized repeat protein (TIGR01451 family)
VNGQGVSPLPGTTYQNTATVSYLDPLRTAAGTQVSPGGTYTPGGLVPGSNYPSALTTNEDVKIISGTTVLTITKDNGGISLVAGQTTSYTVTVANLGPTSAPNAVLKDSFSSGLNCTTVTCASTTGGASCPTGLTLATPIAASAVPNLFNGTGITIATFPAPSSVVVTVTCGVTATGQ